MTDSENDVSKALAAFGAPPLKYRSFTQAEIRQQRGEDATDPLAALPAEPLEGAPGLIPPPPPPPPLRPAPLAVPGAGLPPIPQDPEPDSTIPAGFGATPDFLVESVPAATPAAPAPPLPGLQPAPVAAPIAMPAAEPLPVTAPVVEKPQMVSEVLQAAAPRRSPPVLQPGLAAEHDRALADVFRILSGRNSSISGSSSTASADGADGFHRP